MNLFSGAKILVSVVRIRESPYYRGFSQKISQQERVYKDFQFLSKMVGRGGGGASLNEVLTTRDPRYLPHNRMQLLIS